MNNAEQHFTCLQCGRCCRRFYVPCSQQEAERIASLCGESLPGITCQMPGSRGKNKLCFSHQRESLKCHFWDEKTGLCTLHQKHGYEAKAVACRAYPLSFFTPFPGETTVFARFDCPGVRSASGEPLAKQRPSHQRIIQELQLDRLPSAIQEELCSLNKPSLLRLKQELLAVLNDSSLSLDDQMRLLMLYAIRGAQFGGPFLNDQKTMDQVYPSLRKTLRQELSDLPLYNAGWLGRFNLRKWTTAFIRRDEELVGHGLIARIMNALRLLRFILGMGLSPRLRCSLQDDMKVCSPDQEEDLVRSYYRAKIDSLQFFGTCYYRTDVFTGLKALILSYAAMKMLANLIGWEMAVASIDYALGRSPALMAPSQRRLENSLVPRFTALLLQERR